MSWTVACFCGNVYSTTPPGRCPGCGAPVDDAVRDAGPHAGHDVRADMFEELALDHDAALLTRLGLIRGQ
jgi:hypothetical protein